MELTEPTPPPGSIGARTDSTKGSSQQVHHEPARQHASGDAYVGLTPLQDELVEPVRKDLLGVTRTRVALVVPVAADVLRQRRCTAILR